MTQIGATPSGTKSYPHHTPPQTLGRTGWAVSPVGFGGYRIHTAAPFHREALRLALTSGCNLIDTSTNYGDGASESLVGQVLQELILEQKLSRDQIVLVTKIGYVQGQNLKLARQRRERGIPFSDMVEFTDDCWHCISPDFLRDQITRSLQRLRQGTIDVLLLHNPEYFLKAGGHHSEYYQRIKKAFEYLETEVKQGRIQHYGISSNTFPEAKEADDFTSLETVWGLAQEIGSKSFSVIQFPFNLYEPEAAFECNNDGKTVFETAEAKNLGTLLNRPLNAFYGNKLIRLSNFPDHHGSDTEELLKQAFLEALQTEADYRAQALLPARNVAWAHILQHNFEKISDLEGWKSILEHQIEPALEEIADILGNHESYSAWCREYLTALETLCERITQYLEQLSSLLSKRICQTLDDSVSALKTSPTLSQKAIRIYRSIPGTSCVLVGMRAPEYVKDCLSLQPTLLADDAMRALDAIQEDIEGGT